VCTVIPQAFYQTSVEHLSELNALLGTVSKLLSVDQKRGASLRNVCIIFGTCENKNIMTIRRRYDSNDYSIIDGSSVFRAANWEFHGGYSNSRASSLCSRLCKPILKYESFIPNKVDNRRQIIRKMKPLQVLTSAAILLQRSIILLISIFLPDFWKK